jgi:hypothetical protein
VWDNSDCAPVHSKTIENKAAHLGLFLNVMACQNAALASHVLLAQLTRKERNGKSKT